MINPRRQAPSEYLSSEPDQDAMRRTVRVTKFMHGEDEK
jgi:hypothetical protein